MIKTIKLRIILYAFVIFITIVLVFPANTVFASAYGTNTYTYWYWPQISNGYDSFTWTVTPEYEATTENGVFWSHQFSIKNGDAGYFGLQNNGSAPSGKIAIFSIWEALYSESPEYASTFGGEGIGYTSRISYNWEVNTVYELSIFFDGNDGSGDWWKATIKNQSNGVTNIVGRIKVPSSWEKLNSNSIMWTESYIGLNSCSSLQFTGVVFGSPIANNSTLPNSHTNTLQSPSDLSRIYCPGSYSVDVSALGGVRHWMGASFAPQEPESEQFSNNTLLQAEDSTDIYAIRNAKRHRIPDMATFYAKGYQLKDVQIVDISTLAAVPEDFTFFPEGSLIRGEGDIDVWIIKYVGEKQFKRIILSPTVFNSYGHLYWKDILDIPIGAVDAFIISDLVRAQDDTKVYRLFPSGDIGIKRWIPSEQEFIKQGFDWDAIYTINSIDRDAYSTAISY